jgi:Restriction endonuclease BglII
MPNQSIIPADISERYEVFEWRNGLAILASAHPDKLANILDVLRGYSFTKNDVLTPGGAKGLIASKLDSHFTKLGWIEKKFETKILAIFSVPKR